ncbi:hypothetical protein IBTHAUMO2_750003 [Nitrosopumilaceae archaeon]|nr:hypothetical protein IBTHAUMO2_750003 [Nitrosopumilaceae archaeon]
MALEYEKYYPAECEKSADEIVIPSLGFGPGCVMPGDREKASPPPRARCLAASGHATCVHGPATPARRHPAFPDRPCTQC